MRKPHRAVLALLVSNWALMAPLEAQSIEWLTDAEEARRISADAERPLLVLADGVRSGAPYSDFQTKVLESARPLDDLVRLVIPLRLAPAEYGAFGVRGLPTLLVIGTDGREKARWEGAPAASEVWGELERLLDWEWSGQTVLPAPLAGKAGRFTPLSQTLWSQENEGQHTLWHVVKKTGPYLILKSFERGLTLALPVQGGRSFVINEAAGVWLPAYELSGADGS